MRKQLRLLGYEIRYAWLGIKRHFLISFSAMSAVMVTLFLVGLFLIGGLSLEFFSKQVESDLAIHTVLRPDLNDPDQIEAIESQIEALPEVVRVDYSDKANELELMILEKGEAFEMYRGDENPLGDAFFVYVENGEDLESVAAALETIEGVSSVAYGGTSVISLVDLIDQIRWGASIAIGLLLILSFYLIYNTIRTTIYSRADDIIIMRQVGAENSFVKRPFEIEGILISLVGGIIPYALIAYGYPKLYAALHGQLFANVFQLIEPQTIILISGFALLLSALLIGWLASYLAVNKYLKEKR